jgi:NADH-ubiquinone oxidoreductase chain 2
MILSAALDRGYIFMALVAILTSVIGAGYYLNVVKQIFFYKNNYKTNPSINNVTLTGYITPHTITGNGLTNINDNSAANKTLIVFKPENISINSGLSSSMSIITLLLVLFIYIPTE